MKKALAVLNVGERSIHKASRASFLSACDRWGCEFVEFTQPLHNCHHFWQKAFAIERLTAYDRVLQLDADMLIRWDAPSPFDLVPDDHIGVVSARQFTPPPQDFAVTPPTASEHRGLVISRHRDGCVRTWAARMGMEPCHDERHLNGGFFLYSPRIHAALFGQLRSVGEASGWNKWRLPEQAALSILLHNLDVPQTWLPKEWNIVAAAQRHTRPEHHTGFMNGYIYHFTGKVDRGKRIANTMWQKAPCDEIAERLFDGAAWAEVGVADGYNSLAVLSRAPSTRATLVDSWGEVSERYMESGDLAARLTAEQWKRVKSRAESLTAKYHPRIIHASSEAAAAAVDDASLDLVYIDAEHTYDAVKADIGLWLPKVRAGGWIGGHDYDHPMERIRGKWGVRAAVDELFGDSVQTGVCHTWFVQKPALTS